jgi:hypothetical protein
MDEFTVASDNTVYGAARTTKMDGKHFPRSKWRKKAMVLE